VITGVVLTVITGAVILGGIKRIASVANWLVPFMAIGYVLAALIVLVVNAANIPSALALIFETAFTGTAAVGGFTGAAMIAAIRYGVARGIFSNEAGLGTAGIAQAAGMSNDPVRSGLIGMMGTFFDTIVVCSMTGLAIVVSGAWQSGETGAALTQLAFQSGMPGIGDEVVAVALGIFALTTILGWAYYGERCWHFLVGDWTILPYRIVWTIMVFFGAITHLDLAWTIADTLNALMAIPNLIALLALSPVVIQLTRAGLDRALREA
jgi:AGCS family alanine or glycine:cation symporter